MKEKNHEQWQNYENFIMNMVCACLNTEVAKLHCVSKCNVDNKQQQSAMLNRNWLFYSKYQIPLYDFFFFIVNVLLSKSHFWYFTLRITFPRQTYEDHWTIITIIISYWKKQRKTAFFFVYFYSRILTLNLLRPAISNYLHSVAPINN